MSHDDSDARSARRLPERRDDATLPVRLVPAAGEQPLRHAALPRAGTGHHRDLRVLRRAYRRQRRVTTAAVLGYFALFLALSAGAPAFMDRPAAGGLSVGLLLALSQIPATWLAVLLYEGTARRYVDPLARRVNRSVPWAGGEQERER
ncbi:DUF485 domain-containing protein [Streptomyces sp. NPDC048566]|uniref:DUF485 domain-containing protein n=1 Tax=Streptomyces sp. NPDC048566 TaxID=3365569 RepID=UPI00371DD122